MDEFFFSLSLNGKKSLCIGPITRREAANLHDSNMGDGTGLYLFVVDADQSNEISVIARIDSCETAAMFANMLKTGVFPQSLAA
jgi:hypothetical protein